MVRKILLAFLILFPVDAIAKLTLTVPASVSIQQGSINKLVVSATSTRTKSISFSLKGVPSGVSFTKTPSRCKPPCAATFTIKVSTTANVGSYMLTVNVKDDNNSASKTTLLQVVAAASPEPPPPLLPPAPPVGSSLYEGFGAQTQGGSGYPIVVVSNLDDSGPGSFREAISAGNRTIQFSVAGIITAKSKLKVFGANITIDGCSAPSPGITITGYQLEMRGNYGSHDIIAQCLRFRNSSDDGITVAEGAYNIVLHRISSANNGDGAIDIGGWNGQHTRDVTVQYSILSNGAKNMLIKYAPISRITLHHNLFVDTIDRNPRIGYNVEGGSPAPEITVDMRNNVVANWRGGIGINGECGSKSNIVANYFSNPGYSVADQQQGIVLQPKDGCNRAFSYIEENVSGDVPDINSSRYITYSKEVVPFPAAPITEQDACSAAKLVLESAGHPVRDSIDAAAVAGVQINCQ